MQRLLSFHPLIHTASAWYALSAVRQQLQVLADGAEDNDDAPDMNSMMMMADTVGLFQVLLE